MKPLVVFTGLQASLCGLSCWIFAAGRFSVYGAWSGAAAAFFAVGWLVWSLATWACWTDDGGSSCIG